MTAMEMEWHARHPHTVHHEFKKEHFSRQKVRHKKVFIYKTLTVIVKLLVGYYREVAWLRG